MRFLSTGLGLVSISPQRLRNRKFGVFMIFCFWLHLLFVVFCSFD
jgi:hypothetical protein